MGASMCVVCLFGLGVSELTRILFMLHDSICSAFLPQDAAAYLKAYTSIFFLLALSVLFGMLGIFPCSWAPVRR